MSLELDRTSKIPFYQQIVQQLRDAILADVLPAGSLLPPERRLADELGVNRSTVLNAYRELKRDGLVEARVGRGTEVLARPAADAGLPAAAALPWRQLLRDRAGAPVDSLTRDLLERAGDRDVVPLSVGLPSPDLVPVKELGEVQAALADALGPQLYMHTPTEGLPELRRALAEHLLARGINCGPDEVLVVSGSQQGIDLTVRAFCAPGDAVIVEEPTYFGSLEIFRAAGVRLIPVPVDEHGMVTEALAAALKRHAPRLIYVQPSYQNPTGATLSPARRVHLLDLAARHQVPVLEDDVYRELGYSGESPPPLRALDRHGVVLYLGTVSKVMAPGLRVGWVVAPPAVGRRLAVAKQGLDLHSSTLGQWLVARFLEEGRYDAHAARVRPIYARRCDRLITALAEDPDAGLSWARPRGGLSLWCRLPDRTDRRLLLTRAAEAGVSFIPGACCFPCGVEDVYARLNYSFPAEADLATGAARFLTAVRESRRRPAASVRAAAGPPAIV